MKINNRALDLLRSRPYANAAFVHLTDGEAAVGAVVQEELDELRAEVKRKHSRLEVVIERMAYEYAQLRAEIHRLKSAGDAA